MRIGNCPPQIEKLGGQPKPSTTLIHDIREHFVGFSIERPNSRTEKQRWWWKGRVRNWWPIDVVEGSHLEVGDVPGNVICRALVSTWMADCITASSQWEWPKKMSCLGNRIATQSRLGYLQPRIRAPIPAPSSSDLISSHLITSRLPHSTLFHPIINQLSDCFSINQLIHRFSVNRLKERELPPSERPNETDPNVLSLSPSLLSCHLVSSRAWLS